MTKRIRLCISLLAFISTAACTSAPLTWRDSTPCPRDAGSIETWCDDLGSCEYRVTTGGTFRCNAGEPTGCARAMSEAIAACEGAGIPDGGAPIPSTCVTDVPCVEDAQCTAVAGTSCNTNTSRCQTVLCAADGVACSNNAHCAGELACTSGRCSALKHTYFISAWSIPAPASTERAVGINLDGLNSTGECTLPGCVPTCVDLMPDFLSVTDPSEAGVDNAFGVLVPTFETLLTDETLDDSLSRQVNSGDFLILLELAGVQGPDDPEVMVQLYAGRIPAGRAISDRVFDATPMGSAMSGSITRGQLRFSSPELSVPIRAGDLNAALRIRATQWRVNLSSDSSLTGIIGGAIDVRELAQAVAMSRPGLEETVLDVLGGSADLMPSAADPTQCQSLSIGMSFVAEPAAIAGR